MADAAINCGGNEAHDRGYSSIVARLTEAGALSRSDVDKSMTDKVLSCDCGKEHGRQVSQLLWHS